MSTKVSPNRNTHKVNKVVKDNHNHNNSKNNNKNNNNNNNNQDDDEDEEEEEEDKPTLLSQFIAFVKYRDEENPGTHILLSQSNFWMTHAGLIKGRILTTTDTGICYFKYMKHKLNYDEYLDFLKSLADYKKISVDEIIDKLVNCGPPPQEMMGMPPPH